MKDFHEMEVQLDFARQKRLGFDEAIFCAQKSVAQIDEILGIAQQNNISLLLTRLSMVTWEGLETDWGSKFDYDPVSQTGYFQFSGHSNLDKKVAIVTAGTSDVPTAKEAMRTLYYYGVGSHEIYDVGVAGLWRLIDRIEDINAYPIVIAVAGMDAALPSVLGGLFGGLMIAVPTSTGYGVAEGGHTALNAALVSCAPGVLVCNIDNGYGAACAALRVLNAFGKHKIN